MRQQLLSDSLRHFRSVLLLLSCGAARRDGGQVEILFSFFFFLQGVALHPSLKRIAYHHHHQGITSPLLLLLKKKKKKKKKSASVTSCRSTNVKGLISMGFRVKRENCPHPIDVDVVGQIEFSLLCTSPGGKL